MTNEELLSVAEIVERLVARFNAQAAEHEAKMVEHRAAFGARTTADAKIIAGLRAEVSDLRSVLDMVHASLGIKSGDHIGGAIANLIRAKDCAQDEWARHEERCKALSAGVERVTSERDLMRAEVAALQERLRASIARGDFAQMEISALKSQTPKGHPVKVGEWVRRTTRGSVAQIGAVGTVMVVWSDAYQVQLRKGFSTIWSFRDCTPCAPPTEATHDTPAGKQAAESVIRDDWKTEPADAIKVGDLVEVFQTTVHPWTSVDDVGCRGRVTSLNGKSMHNTFLVRFDDEHGNSKTVALADVRKVTT